MDKQSEKHIMYSTDLMQRRTRECEWQRSRVRVQTLASTNTREY